ncbi:MAG: PKD domain-containing protein [Saprospiraceae bacterium]|nr:PKD domain-containing protein [Saprospiraceae bacterium]
MRLFLLPLLLFFLQNASAQTCNYLVYDGFAYSANTPLEGLQGGTGWQAPWNVQSENTTLPGFQITAASPLQWLDLQAAGNYASGGFAYLTAGRRLNTSTDGPFADWLTQDGTIGKAGTTLWASILLRKNQNNDETVAVLWHESNLQWCEGCTSNKVAVGYFGANSNVGGQRRWTLRIHDQYYPTSVPMTPNETAFFVLKFEFLAGSTSVSLFVNPSSLGNDAPAPTPTLTQTTNDPVLIRSLALYLGDDAASGQADEIRMGATYACTVPDPAVAVNQPPNAVFSMNPPAGMGPLQVALDASASSDPDGNIVFYSWDFGDGSPDASGQTVQHTFTATGTLTVTLTVEDDQGVQHAHAKTITVLNASGSFSCQLGLVNEKLASCTGNDGRFRVTNYNNIPLQLKNSGGATVAPVNGNPNLYDNLAPGIYQLTASGANGCRDTFNVFIQRDSNTCPGWTPDPCAMKIGVGIEGLAYWTPSRPFKDLFKSCGGWITYDPNPPGGNFVWNTENQAHIPTNADGYATQIPFNVPNGSGQNLLRGIISASGFIPQGVPIRLVYEGVGTLQMQGNVTVTNNQPGQIDFVVNDDGNIFFNLTASQSGNPVRNIRVVELSNINTYQSQPFRQGFLDKCSEFNTLRFMDWSHTNGSDQAQWTDRTLPNYYSQAESPNGGLAYEYIIQLANQLDKNIWVCIPHLADDDYIAQMAAMLLDQLEPGITVYIEYSNEVWNWIFPQAIWVAENGPQNISYPRRYVERATHAFEIWNNVWGSQNTRLRRVLGTQNGYDWITEEILAHADQDQYDYISPSWYVGLNHGPTGNPNLQALGAAATPEDVLENANNVFLNFYPHWEMVYNTAKLYGKKVVNYEGGQHFTDFSIPPYIQSMYDAQVLPGMYDLYDRMLDSLRRLGSELPLAFVLTGPWQSQYGSWGHIFDEDDPAPWTDRPKFQVLIDQMAQCVETPTGIKPIENQSIMEVRIFPNPTTGVFQLEIPAEWSGEIISVRITDALGQTWFVQRLSGNQITLGDVMPNGVYWVEVLDGEGRTLGRNRVVKVGK